MPHKQPHVSTCCTLNHRVVHVSYLLLGSLTLFLSVYEAQTGPRQAKIHVFELHAFRFAANHVNDSRVWNRLTLQAQNLDELNTDVIEVRVQICSVGALGDKYMRCISIIELSSTSSFLFSPWHKTLHVSRFQTHKYVKYAFWTWRSLYKIYIWLYIETPKSFK